MSTRATIHFIDGGNKENTPIAIVFRHGDGCPDALGKDLFSFFKEVKSQCKGFVGGTRLDDAVYLSAKWVVYDAVGMAMMYHRIDNKIDDDEKVDLGDVRLLRFLSVGIVYTDPTDIDYRYLVVCSGRSNDKEFPKVFCQKVKEVEDKNGTESLIVEKEWQLK
jgi:hypothetical protein